MWDQQSVGRPWPSVGSRAKWYNTERLKLKIEHLPQFTDWKKMYILFSRIYIYIYIYIYICVCARFTLLMQFFCSEICPLISFLPSSVLPCKHARKAKELKSNSQSGKNLFSYKYSEATNLLSFCWNCNYHIWLFPL